MLLWQKRSPIVCRVKILIQNYLVSLRMLWRSRLEFFQQLDSAALVILEEEAKDHAKTHYYFFPHYLLLNSLTFSQASFGHPKTSKVYILGYPNSLPPASKHPLAIDLSSPFYIWSILSSITAILGEGRWGFTFLYQYISDPSYCSEKV